MRGVTAIVTIWENAIRFQLTRLMRGVTFQRSYVKVLLNIISTHTPHARRDFANVHNCIDL